MVLEFDHSPQLLNDEARKRLEQQRQDLQAAWNLRAEKIQVLRQDWVIESSTSVKFQLQKQIEDEEAEQNKLTASLEKLEQVLGDQSSATEPVAPINPSQDKRLPSISDYHFSAYNPRTFAGRAGEIAQLTEFLGGSCRVLAITGMTGIGKTALAERVVAQVIQTGIGADLPYIRFSLDDRSLTPDFGVSGAALLRALGEEPTLADQQDAVNLVAHILQLLCCRPCRLQIDSLERLLKGNEQEGWSEFCDPLWLDFLQQFLAGSNCPSQILLTSQDIPAELEGEGSRYPQFWQCQTLQGLNADEQQEFFQKLGVLPDPKPDILLPSPNVGRGAGGEGQQLSPPHSNLSETDLGHLLQIGAYYAGHPLVLQVIADEILQPPFQGNIGRYWHHYAAEFTATAEGTTNTLARSRVFRRRVRQRVEQSLQRLPSSARQMLCACAVFRRPVPEGFWLAMVPEGEPEVAFDTLRDRHLLEFVPMAEQTIWVRQHNLIRSVAYDLLRGDETVWEQAQRRAAELWLEDYEPASDAPKLEILRGYLEALEHYCQVGDWESASKIYTLQIPATNQQLHWQLSIWAFYKELLTVSSKLVDHISTPTKRICLNQIGNSYMDLGNTEKAINFYHLALQFTRETGDRQGEGGALGNLGTAYNNLGQYEKAIELFQQDLDIAREIGDRQGEGIAQCGLGNAYDSLGQYQQAIELYQQHLAIAREIGDRKGEGNAQCGLGNAYDSLGQYQQAIEFHQQHLAIAREIGDRQGEGAALGNLGIAYYSLGQYQQAIELYQQYLVIAREIGDRKGEGNAQCGLGNAYDSLGQYQQAIEFHQQHLAIAREIGYRRGEGIALGNLGIAYKSLGQYQQAIEFHQQHLAIAREIGDRKGEGNALGNLGNAYDSLGQYQQAIELYQQFLEIAREIGDRRGGGIAIVNLGGAYLKLEEYSECATHNQLALEIFREIGDRANESEALKNLAELHQALGEIELARQYGQQALALATELGIPLAAECQTFLEKLNLEGEIVEKSIS